jgi:hypothetical protein
MNMPAIEAPCRHNPLQIGKILRMFLCLAPLLAGGLSFVYLKNQQFALGEQIRQTERAIRETRAENEVLLARVTSLTSRRALQERVATGFISVVPVSGDKIARLTPPAQDTDTTALRTAFNGASLQ